MKKLLALFAVLVFCNVANAQSNISLDLKDAPVRTTLEMAFKQAGIKNYVIDNSVNGFITMTISDQPFENTLKLIMRANTSPLTYTKENDVYIVKSRRITIEANPEPSSYANFIMEPSRNSKTWEKISLTFIDPVDLMSAFGNILLINQFSRYTGGMNGSGMGGFGGGAFGGMNGGMGGFGGGRNF